MLEAIVVVLVALWLVGWVASFTFGGLIHLLLVGALLVLAVGWIHRRSRRE